MLAPWDEGRRSKFQRRSNTFGYHSPWSYRRCLNKFLPVAKTSVKYAKNNYLIALGAAIRDVRGRSGVSQEALALRAEVDRSYLGGIERGEVNLALINIVKIAAALEMSVEALMREAQL